MCEFLTLIFTKEIFLLNITYKCMECFFISLYYLFLFRLIFLQKIVNHKILTRRFYTSRKIISWAKSIPVPV